MSIKKNIVGGGEKIVIKNGKLKCLVDYVGRVRVKLNKKRHFDELNPLQCVDGGAVAAAIRSSQARIIVKIFNPSNMLTNACVASWQQ